MKIAWHGKDVVNKVEDTLVNRMQVLGAMMVRDIQNTLRHPGPTSTHPQYAASVDGEPPHTRTRRLLRSITSELDKRPVPILRVGTNVKYAVWLELGTKTMAARPFLRPALMRARRDINRLLRRGAR